MKFTRRNMIKALAAACLAAAGAPFLWELWRKRAVNTGALGTSVVPPEFQGKEPLFGLYLLSDIHMSTTNDTMADKLHMALKDITAFQSPVQTIVLGGDLVDGGWESEYEKLRDIFSNYELPHIYGNMGNHEYYDIHYNANGDWSPPTAPNGKADAQARERFMRFMGYEERPYHDVWVGGVHLIMMSQEAYVQERPEVGEGAWYSDEQLRWLAEKMRPHVDGSPAFVFIHQPLPPDGEDGGQHRLIRAKEFRAILKPYRNVFVFSGHTHRNLETEGRYVRDSAFHWFSNASVGKTRGAGTVEKPVQGLYIQVYPNQVVVLGREFSNRTWITAAQWSVPLA